MIPINDEQEIVRMSMQKAQLEMDLARSLYNFFNTAPRITYLRNVIDTAISTIVEDLGGMHRNFAQRNVFEVAVKKSGKNLAVFTRRGMNSNLNNLRLLLGQKNTWTAADCSDFIRLFGELVENKMLDGSYGYQALSPELPNQKESWRPKVQFHPDHRARLRGQAYKPAQSGPHVANARAVMLALRRDPGFAGINKTLLNRAKSTVSKIDYVYGLAEGCDISGTTADSLFFHTYLEPFCTTAECPPWMFMILHLLPLATMVYQSHHTILECALTISCDQRTGTEYSVGKYHTLLPRFLRGQGLGPLEGILRRFDHDYRNHRMLCYFDPANYSVRANYYDKQWEWVEFHRVSTFRNDQFLITKFLSAPLPVTHQVLQNIFEMSVLPI